jgi:CO/xanthine dehydrogenase FAD-binding subunit
MNDWDIVQPVTTGELKNLLAGSAGRLLAGGTDLLPGLRRAPADQPVRLIDISRLADLRFIREAGSEIEIGALTTHAAMTASPLIQKYAPALVKACSEIGAPQTRARGTLGGNLANASPAADTVTPLLCLDSRVKLASKNGERVLKLDEFFLGPGKTGLISGEFLNSVSFGIPSGRWGTEYLKLGRRNGMAIAVISVGVFLILDDAGRIDTIRIAFGSAAPTPVRGRCVEAALKGNKPAPDLFALAAQAVDEDISPISDVRATGDYRRNSARVLIVRALESALKQAESRMP